jgi:hypothetical protein
MNISTLIRVQWERTLACLLVLGGVITLLIGYHKISGTPHVAQQFPYLVSGGLFGLLLLVVGCMLWLSATLRDEWREVRTVRILLQQSTGAEPVDHVVS